MCPPLWPPWNPTCCLTPPCLAAGLPSRLPSCLPDSLRLEGCTRSHSTHCAQAVHPPARPPPLPLQDCNYTIPDGWCLPSERYPGFWEMPMHDLQARAATSASPRGVCGRGQAGVRWPDHPRQHLRWRPYHVAGGQPPWGPPACSRRAGLIAGSGHPIVLGMLRSELRWLGARSGAQE